ncbi:D-alanine--D-alanine ligase [Endobacter medicaginis]|uniref:D-alanine--D-alanine ligase n=1 Tax=Endobacter medicaginis TaxID=1181271 RepID=A0A850NVX8_9PROT|nr:D-alanine--D-alanine ligase [Endobacter medicaginis]
MPARAATDAAGPRILSRWEFLPGWAVYTPLVVQWIALGLRHGSFALPCLSNPTIPTGGMVNESKADILSRLGDPPPDFIARWATLTAGASALAEAEAAMTRLGLAFPVVLKPDIGCRGAGVKLVGDHASLVRALAAFRPGVALMLQYLVPHEGEAGVFWSRAPGASKGEILSITLKHSPRVTGDGVRTLRALIEAHPRAGKVPHLYLPRLADRLDEVPPAGEEVRLVFTGNHCRGSVFTDATSLATDALRERLEAILSGIEEFHHGRVDLRFADLDRLLAGHDFTLIEINGVGSEATHVWDARTTLREIFASQARITARAFAIGNANRRRGWRSPGILDLLKQWRRQVRLVRDYPPGD